MRAEKRSLTLAELDAIAEKMVELKEAAKALEEKKKEKESEFQSLAKTLMEELSEHGKTSYAIPGFKLIRQEKLNITLPSDPDKKEEFYRYLKKRGLFESLVSINYQTLNGFYRSEFNTACEEGKTDFEIPGLGSPTHHEYIAIRKEGK